MISFLIAIVALIASYFLYGRLVEHLFGVDENRITPAIRMQDGVDYVPMPSWKLFLIQFLNIAGIGPIFGAIAGALWGPAAFLWIVLGTIFAGGVNHISISLLGPVGGILAVLGVVFCPVSSGDTAFRSARLTIADFLNINQKPFRNRLMIAIPLFISRRRRVCHNGLDAVFICRQKGPAERFAHRKPGNIKFVFLYMEMFIYLINK